LLVHGQTVTRALKDDFARQQKLTGVDLEVMRAQLGHELCEVIHG
jgi:hypothetical protein